MGEEPPYGGGFLWARYPLCPIGAGEVPHMDAVSYGRGTPYGGGFSWVRYPL